VERRDGELMWAGHRLVYEERGSGDRPIVLLHGLLLPAGVNGHIADQLAERGHRVILLELLGHGESDKPPHAYHYRMDKTADQVVALLDHLGIDRAVVGGVSLGANVTLQLAVYHPDRLVAGVCEMPVLERGTVGVLLQLAPLLFLFRYAGSVIRPVFRALHQLKRVIPNEVVAAVFETAGDPREMAAVLHGFAAGPVCPPYEQRVQIEHPVFVIGHKGDWIHPMDDALALARELPNARLHDLRHFFEARIHPDRVVDDLDNFLEEVWTAEQVHRGARVSS
jgi:pimeloyl-ACP methyl ester carboxylesterase